jgi:hypothetical protein
LTEFLNNVLSLFFLFKGDKLPAALKLVWAHLLNEFENISHCTLESFLIDGVCSDREMTDDCAGVQMKTSTSV